MKLEKDDIAFLIGFLSGGAAMVFSLWLHGFVVIL